MKKLQTWGALLPLLYFIASLGPMNPALAVAGAHPSVSSRTWRVTTHLPDSNSPCSGPIAGCALDGAWHELPAPYNRSAAELNDMRGYDTQEATDARARLAWTSAPEPFRRNVHELIALRRNYRRAACPWPVTGDEGVSHAQTGAEAVGEGIASPLKSAWVGVLLDARATARQALLDARDIETSGR